MKFTTVLFDLDETLSDHIYSVEKTFLVMQDEYPAMKSHSLESLIQLYREALDVTFADFLANKITHGEAKRRRVALFFEKLGAPIKEEDVDAYLSRYSELYLSDRRATLGTIETLTMLKAHGFKIGVVTNGGEEVQVPKLKEIGIESYIDALISSGAIGFAKPAPEIFAVALERLGSKKEETLMIGDSLENDVKGALRFGIAALYYAPLSKETEIMVDSVAVPVISHMQQLLNYLGIK